MASTGRMPRTQHFGIFKVMLHTWTQMNNYFEKESYRTQDSYGKEEGYEWSLCMQSDRHTRPEGHQGWESLLTKKSETWIQIQRYVEMLAFLLFGNPWGYRFQGAFGNSIQSTREVDKWAGIQPKYWTLSSLSHFKVWTIINYFFQGPLPPIPGAETGLPTLRSIMDVGLGIIHQKPGW